MIRLTDQHLFRGEHLEYSTAVLYSFTHDEEHTEKIGGLAPDFEDISMIPHEPGEPDEWDMGDLFGPPQPPPAPPSQPPPPLVFPDLNHTWPEPHPGVIGEGPDAAAPPNLGSATTPGGSGNQGGIIHGGVGDDPMFIPAPQQGPGGPPPGAPPSSLPSRGSSSSGMAPRFDGHDPMDRDDRPDRRDEQRQGGLPHTPTTPPYIETERRVRFDNDALDRSRSRSPASAPVF